MVRARQYDRGIIWELVDDKIAVQEGRQPTALRHQRRARVLPLMDEIMRLATKLGVSRTELAKELGVTRISLYHWQNGSAVPSMKNYSSLLRLNERLDEQLRGQRA